jgi:hypothetical protein
MCKYGWFANVRVGYYKLHFVWGISAIRTTTTVAHDKIRKAGADVARVLDRIPTTTAAGTATTTAIAKITAGGTTGETDNNPVHGREKDAMRREGPKNATRRFASPSEITPSPISWQSMRCSPNSQKQNRNN